MNHLSEEGRGLITGCLSCGGLWMSAHGYESVRTYDLSPRTKLDLDRVVRSRRPRPRGPYRGACGTGGCPVCSDVLTPRAIAETGIQGRVCQDHGIFLSSSMAIRFVTLAFVAREMRDETASTQSPASETARALRWIIFAVVALAWIVRAMS